MINTELSQGIAEVLEILKYSDHIYTEKLPIKLKRFLEENKAKNYSVHIDPNKEFKNQNINKEAFNLISIFYLNYWSTAEEKEVFIKKMRDNEKNSKLKMEEKYNPDNLFKKEKNNNTVYAEGKNKNEVAIVQYKESLFKKIWTIILSIFKR